MATTYQLVFEMDLAKSQQMLHGELSLLKQGDRLNAYLATSSLPGRQHFGSWRERGGLIPPSNELMNHLAYTVTLQPEDSSHIKGINGNFYRINPYSIPQPGIVREALGIHRDANVPGTFGCIGLKTLRGWTAFERDMAKLRNEGIIMLPLQVEYT
jgi:hypothetical protein